MRAQLHLVITGVLAVTVLSGFTESRRTAHFDELTVRRLNVVDSTGEVRVILAGAYPPRRDMLAGLLFVNEDGHEAGGLVYRGTRDSSGTIRAGGILTFDQYRNDQVMALEHSQVGSSKSTGLTISDRPDTLSDLVKQMYRDLDREPPGARRDSLLAHYRTVVPRSDIVSRRLFVGRGRDGSATLSLADPEGRVRLRLEVDSLGRSRIAFIDTTGAVLRSLEP